MNEPTPRFDHTENDWRWTATLLGLIFLASVPLLSARSSHPLNLVVAVIPAALFLLTHSLRVQVDEERLLVQLGNGWIRRSIQLQDIRKLQRRDWHRSWGPRWSWRRSRATVLGFGGREAVCIQLDHEIICIATEAAAELEHFLNARLRKGGP